MLSAYYKARSLIVINALSLACVLAAPSNRDMEALRSYFMRYSNDFSSTVARSSADPSLGSLVDLSPEDNPIFRDHILTFQKMANLETTGSINKETLDKMDEPRCGVPDSIFDPNAPGKYQVQKTWVTKKDRDTGLHVVTYSFPERTTPKNLNFHAVTKGTTLAMCSWELISNFRFKNVGVGKRSADVAITFEKGDHGDGYPFDGQGNTLGHAFYPEDGRLHLDLQEHWYLAKPDAVDRTKKDVYTAVLHEIGHTLGLLHSNEQGALMAPFYQFFGTFEEMKMPEDELKGVADMYGKRIESNPADEEFSACREAKTKYGYEIVPPTAEVMTAAFVDEEFTEAICEDDPSYGIKCPAWKASGFCSETIFVPTLHRRCPRTCGFCTAAVPAKRKPEKMLVPSSLAASICDIRDFDSVMTTYDEQNGFAATIFKDDYVFKAEVELSPAKYETHSLLNHTEHIKGAYRWDTDPKTVLPGLFKIKAPNFMDKSEKAHASVLVGETYFIFEDEQVHIYRRDMEVMTFKTALSVRELFPTYPNLKVDAAHASVDESEDSVTFTLFCGSNMWQYKEFRDRGRANLQFFPLLDRAGVDISEWHGVPACDVDAVFEYRGIPYFLKKNVFWPAVDTEQQIPRDITYNFFRCWQQEPENLSIPSFCNAAKTDQRNGAENLRFETTLSFTVITLIGHVLFNLLA